jgi:magnesium-transporting ATPase (P-type)
MGKDRTRKGSNGGSNVEAQLSEADEAAQQRLTRYHALTVDEVADLLETSSVCGLSPAEAARRLEVYGPNQLRKSEGVKFYMLVVRHLFNFMSFVLFAAFIMACVTQQWIDAGVVAFLIFINTIIGVSQGTRCSPASVAGLLSAHTYSPQIQQQSISRRRRWRR